MAAEVARFGHTIIYDNEGFNRYFAGVFGGTGWLVCALFFLFRSSLALAKETRLTWLMSRSMMCRIFEVVANNAHDGIVLKGN